MFSLADANNHHFALLQKCLNLLPDPITAFPFTDEPAQLILQSFLDLLLEIAFEFDQFPKPLQNIFKVILLINVQPANFLLYPHTKREERLLVLHATLRLKFIISRY